MMNKNIHVDFESKISDNNLDSVDTYLEDSYPNPYFSDSYSSNKIVIGYKTPANSTSYIYVYNQSGNLVQTFNVKSNENKIEFDINSLKSGLYTYVLVVNNVSVFTKKITIL